MDSDIVDESLSECGEPGADEERAVGLAQRKLASCANLPADRAMGRVVRHLGSKGYGPQMAWEVARRVFRDLELPSD